MIRLQLLNQLEKIKWAGIILQLKIGKMITIMPVYYKLAVVAVHNALTKVYRALNIKKLHLITRILSSHQEPKVRHHKIIDSKL